jgi:hypothetical protein
VNLFGHAVDAFALSETDEHKDEDRDDYGKYSEHNEKAQPDEVKLLFPDGTGRLKRIHALMSGTARESQSRECKYEKDSPVTLSTHHDLTSLSSCVSSGRARTFFSTVHRQIYVKRWIALFRGYAFIIPSIMTSIIMVNKIDVK